MNETQKKKRNFRSSKIWKLFRKQKMNEQKGIDPITKKKLCKGFNVHHRHVTADTDEYHEQTKDKPKTVNEYFALIDNCEDEQAINRLFYEWSKVYQKGTNEYNQLSNKSFERKKQIVGA